MMAVWGLHLEFAPDVAGGALFPYLESMANQTFGIALGQGGADTIIRAMVKLIKQQGDEVLTGQAVQRVEVQAGRATGVLFGRATGVLLTDGTRIAAGRAVITKLHPKALYGRLLAAGQEDVPAKQPAAARLRPGPGTMMIHLALGGLPAWRAGAELSRYADVHIAPSLDQMARTYGQALAGLLPAEPVLVVGQPTVFDPSRAPPGGHVLWVQVRVLPAVVTGDAAGQMAPAHWDQLKEAYADRAMALLERHAPGVAGRVLARQVMSPTDLERDNPNLKRPQGRGADLLACGVLRHRGRGQSTLAAHSGQRRLAGSRQPGAAAICARAVIPA